MPTQFIKIIIVVLLFLCSYPLWASEIEPEIKSLEAGLIYETALKQVVDGQYNKALKRLDWIVSVYPETRYMQLATDKKEEVGILLQQPKPISNMSRAGLVGFGTLFTTWLGIGTLVLLDVNEPGPNGLVLIAGPVGGLLGSLNLTRESELTDGQGPL